MKPFRYLVVGFLCALAANADEPGGQKTPVFSVHDRNLDGYIDPAEFELLSEKCRARRAQRRGGACPSDFTALDLDRDGRIDEQEVLSAIGRRRGRDQRHERGSGKQ